MPVTPAQLAAHMVARKKKELDAERERARAIRERLERLIAEHGRAGKFARAILIGSLASGTFGAGSDVDVVVEGLDPEQHGVLYGALVEALGVEVDLLRLEELGASFRERVLKEGVELYGT